MGGSQVGIVEDSDGLENSTPNCVHLCADSQLGVEFRQVNLLVLAVII